MSDPHNPAAPAARTRPSSVTISSYLLFLVALLFAIGAIVSLSTLGTVSDVYQDAYAGTEVEGAEGLITVVGALASIVQLLFAAAFVVLALLNNRGRNGSRIVTWVFGGLGICCTGINLSSSAFSGMNTGSTGDMPDAAEIQRRISEELPGWIGPVNTASNVIGLLALLGAVILLALPASNEFFRKPQTMWEPPVPGSTYLGQPPYPGQTSAYPGQPSAGPGYPPAGAPAGYPPAGHPPAAPSGEPGYPPVPPPSNQPPSNQPPPGDQSEPPSGPSAPPPAR